SGRGDGGPNADGADSLRGGESAQQGRSAVSSCASPSAHPVGAEMIRTAFIKTTLLALLATPAGVIAAGSPSALASTGALTGGASSSPTTLGPAHPRPVHKPAL